MLVVAINNPAQANQIVHFAREINPRIKIIARAFDRFDTFALYQAGADDVIRETFDSAVRAGKRALINLGMAPKMAKAISQYYFDADRHEVALMSQVYDPDKGIFKNPAMVDIARECDQKMAEHIQEIILSTEPKYEELEESEA